MSVDFVLPSDVSKHQRMILPDLHTTLTCSLLVNKWNDVVAWGLTDVVPAFVGKYTQHFLSCPRP